MTDPEAGRGGVVLALVTELRGAKVSGRPRSQRFCDAGAVAGAGVVVHQRVKHAGLAAALESTSAAAKSGIASLVPAPECFWSLLILAMATTPHKSSTGLASSLLDL
jgi:hypothetical protein